ncbi:MAG: HlyD family efflux transporter periplasmic adaptor subunit [Candidatus Paceibacterota bacterium]|jgi:HlyD family secretion protein
MKKTNFFLRIGRFIKRHKIISLVIILIIIVSGYWLYHSKTTATAETKYVIGTVRVGDVSSVVTGTGQVSAESSVDIKSKVSGDIVALYVKNGDEVGEGSIIAQIDSEDALKNLRDAEINLKSAQISLDKVLQPANTSTVYDDAFNTITNAFLDLPVISDELYSMLYDRKHSLYLADDQQVNFYSGKTGVSLKRGAELEYNTAKKLLKSSLATYRTTPRLSEPAVIESLLGDTLVTVRAMSDALKNIQTTVNYISDKIDTDKPSELGVDQSALVSYTSKLNGHVSNVLSSQTSIESAKTSEVNDSLDIQSQKLSLEQKKNAVSDAQDTLSDYYVRAPFGGVVADVPVSVGDGASSAMVLATIITKKQIATIPLNEVDAAKVKTGQKVVLTFDAVSGLEVVGEVSDVQTLGTVSQGVVSYDVQISFDTQDTRVKPSMSVSAAITTDIRESVLSVPTSAVKTSRGGLYVEVVDNVPKGSGTTTAVGGIILSTPPRQQIVEVGLTGDSRIEIISGLNEGDRIVTRTITASGAATTASAGSILTGGNRSTTGQAARALGR